MQTKDAYWFPIVASCVLFSMFLVFKYLPAEYVTMVNVHSGCERRGERKEEREKKKGKRLGIHSTPHLQVVKAYFFVFGVLVLGARFSQLIGEVFATQVKVHVLGGEAKRDGDGVASANFSPREYTPPLSLSLHPFHTHTHTHTASC